MSKKGKNPWLKSPRIELQYARSLRKVAREVGRIIGGFDLAEAGALERMRDALRRYSDILTPWAQKTAEMTVTAIDHQDLVTWRRQTAELTRGLAQEVQHAPVGDELRRFMAEQVRLITSIPIEAGERVHKLAIEAVTETGSRFDEIAEELKRTTHVTESRATMIARTEVARTASALTLTRARHVGAEAYRWQTAKDSAVGPSHAAMQGRIVMFSNPPELDGMIGHAGQFPNCRCWPEPLIDEQETHR